MHNVQMHKHFHLQVSQPFNGFLDVSLCYSVTSVFPNEPICSDVTAFYLNGHVFTYLTSTICSMLDIKCDSDTADI